MNALPASRLLAPLGHRGSRVVSDRDMSDGMTGVVDPFRTSRSDTTRDPLCVLARF